MTRQTFQSSRKPFTCALLFMLLAVGLTIQSGSVTTHGNPFKLTVALPAEDSGRSNESAGKGIETFVEDERRAVVLLYEHNPWAMVVGSDSPTFALYDDGLLIFTRTNQEGRPEYASLTLSEKERDEFLASLPVKQFNELLHEYELDMRTDQPTTVLSVGDRTGLKSVRVYGNLARSMTTDDPQAFVQIYRKLKSFNDARAARWMPEKIELMLWPYDTAGTALSWPKNWPDTAHPTTKKRATDATAINYSIYLTPAQYESRKKQVASVSADALLINKRKWAFSFRFPFPNEDSWRKRASDS
jgi:hypothetical protein